MMGHDTPSMLRIFQGHAADTPPLFHGRAERRFLAADRYFLLDFKPIDTEGRQDDDIGNFTTGNMPTFDFAHLP